jgi:hypothetical protein
MAAVQDYLIADASCVGERDERYDWTHSAPARVPVFSLLIYCSISEQNPLHWSALGGHVEACKLLLSEKADVHARDKKYHPCPCMRFWNALLISCSIREYTPLHCSAFKGHVEACKLLLSEKADVHARDCG